MQAHSAACVRGKNSSVLRSGDKDAQQLNLQSFLWLGAKYQPRSCGCWLRRANTNAETAITLHGVERRFCTPFPRCMSPSFAHTKDALHAQRLGLHEALRDPQHGRPLRARVKVPTCLRSPYPQGLKDATPVDLDSDATQEQCYDNVHVSKNAWDSNLLKVKSYSGA